ncbi:MAG: P27 family phage terminase small subunit, partial [Magnetococcales bacterium]|nr:P27 family phage terminase small subunit [Magnetococcales bacterium]
LQKCRANPDEPIPEKNIGEIDPPVIVQGVPGVKKWWDIFLEDSPEGLFKSIDAGLLEGTCIALYMMEREAAKSIKAGITTTGENGKSVEVESTRVFRNMFALAIQASNSLGLTPVSRSRIHVAAKPTKEDENEMTKSFANVVPIDRQSLRSGKCG